MTEFDMIYNILGAILAIAIANLTFLWSLHAKVTKLQTEKDNCIFCKSDVSADEFKNMKACAAHTNSYLFNNEK